MDDLSKLRNNPIQGLVIVLGGNGMGAKFADSVFGGHGKTSTLR
jgi:hypothetical protein